VAFVPGFGRAWLLAVGPGGTDLSLDGGRAWLALDGPGYHAMSVTAAGGDGWAVGEDGRIARLTPAPASGR
jgi:hypothetical protein